MAPQWDSVLPVWGILYWLLVVNGMGATGARGAGCVVGDNDEGTVKVSA